MISRRAAKVTEEALDRSPLVAILGPRQVGKTTLARAIAEKHLGAVYLDLERVGDRARLTDADAFLEPLAGLLVVIDEVHRAPHLFERCAVSLIAGVPQGTGQASFSYWDRLPLIFSSSPRRHLPAA